MSPVRVAFDVGPLVGPRTGIGNAVAALHQQLAERSDVTTVDYLVSFRATAVPGRRRLPLPAALALRLWERSNRPSADRWLGDVDVVHGTNYVVPPSRTARLVSVYDCWFLRSPNHAAPNVRRAGAVLRRAVDNGAVIHSCSAATTEALADLMPAAEVVTVALGALPVPEPRPDVPVAGLEGRPYILAVATLERRKNLPHLVRAFGFLAGGEPDLLLVLAGADGDDRQNVDQAILSLGADIAQRVLIVGPIDEPTRSRLLRDAAALAYPSLDEGFGFPLLDAMQVGVPIVASKAGSIPEVTGEAALLSGPHDVAALAADLLAATGDSTVRARLVAAGTARWPTFSWSRCADGLVETYDALAARGAR